MHKNKNRINCQAGLELLEERSLMAAGGGFAGGGLLGSYFATDALPAIGSTPSFARTDARIDQNFSANQAPGGSNDPAFASVSSTDYSVRWTGQVLPRFGETYQLFLTADAGARISIRPSGAANFAVPYDTLGSTAPTAASVSYSFAAGATYDIMVEYDHFAGAAAVKLEWSSPSTPRETVEENQPLGINVGAAFSYPASERYFADAIKNARSYWEKASPDGSGNLVVAKYDAQGWPTEDAGLYVWEGATGNQGTYLLTFKGKATVTAGFGTFVVNGTSYANALPLGAAGAYNSTTDTTTATFLVPTANASTNLYLQFTNAVQKAANGTAGGVSNVALMRPTVVGSATPYAPGAVFTQAYLAALAPFQTIRTHEASRTNDNPVVTWAQRDTPTSWFSQNYVAYTGGSTTAYVQPYNTDGVAWEYLVALANESGKDLYINIPEGAGSTYIANLANLIKYGSDGTNSYTSPQAKPLWKPLDANLRIYLEYSNEVWNTVYTQNAQNASAAVSAVQNHTAEGAVLNYDNLPDNAQNEYVWAMRRVALHIHDISNAFAAVFGPTAMTTTVRPVLCWFNDNQQSSARIGLSFLGNYFDNGDGSAHVANPVPISSYLWGAGAAAYYDGADDEGTQSAASFANAGFESGPANAAWTFAGPGGIAPSGSNGAPQAADGSRVAYLSPGSSISQSVYFGAAGEYGLLFQAANTGRLNIAVDGVPIAVEFPYGSAFSPQVTHYRSDSMPGYFTVATPGPHTITIAADASNSALEYLDAVQITSAAGIFSAPVPVSTGDVMADYAPYPGTGISAASYQRDLALQVNWAKAYGLNPITYESGWSLGEANMSGVQYWAKFRDTNAAQTAAAQTRAIADYDAAGGSLLILGSFPQWEDANTASAAPLVVGAVASESALAPVSNNGFAFVAGQPLVLTPAAVSLQPNNTISDNSQPGYNAGAPATIAAGADNNFLGWNVIVPAAQNMGIAVAIAGPGTYQLWIDNALVDSETVNGPNTFAAADNLAPGLHGIRVVATSKTPLTIAGVTLTAGTASTPPPNTLPIIAAPPAPPAAPPALPAAPSNLQVTAVDGSSVTLKWLDNAANGTGYRIEASTSYGFNAVAAAVGSPANSASATLAGLLPNTIYFLRVTAVNAAGGAAGPLASAQTSVGAAPATAPAAPSNVRATLIASSAVALAWADNATNATGYRLDASRSYGFATVDATVSLPAHSAAGTVVGLLPNTVYFFRVTALNASGGSAGPIAAVQTPAGAAPPVPAAPTNFRVTAAGNSSLGVSWSDNATNETSYLLQASADNFATTAASANLPANSTSATLAGLQAGTSYTLRVTALNGSGGATATLAASTVSALPPAPPSRPVATAVGTTSVALGWTNTGTNATGFTLEASFAYNFGTLAVPAQTLAAGSASATVAGLQPNTIYFFRLTAVNSAGTAAASIGSAQTQAAAPVGFAVSAVNTTSVGLSWSSGANSATGTAVQITASTDPNFGSAVAVVNPPAGSTSAFVFGLQANTKYYFRISATNGAGISPAPAIGATTL